MTMKFKIVEAIDGNVNKQLLNNYRNYRCTRDDVRATFKLIQSYRQRGDPRWIDLYANLAKTISRLRRRGCNVQKLKQTFKNCEKEYLVDST